MRTSVVGRVKHWISLGGLCVLGVAPLEACSDGAGDEAVTPNVEVVDQTREALAAGAIVAVNGTYSGCTSRSGAWSVRVSGSGALTNAPLSVVMNDAACQLVLTEIVADQTYTAGPSITLGSSYASSASAFTASGSSNTIFVANGKLSATSFAGDFVLSLLFSDDPSVADAGSATATYATVQTSTQTTLVAAPSYTINLTPSGNALTVQMDANKVIQAVAGAAALTDGSVTGEAYVVDMGTILSATPTYATVAAAYLLGTERPISGANPSVPASQLGLVGQSLASNVVRTIIVSHTVNGVKAYQLFRITFKSS